MIKIDERYMKESMRAFIEDGLPDAGIDTPDILIILAGKGNNLIFDSSSNSHKKTLDILQRAIYLHEVNTAKLESEL